MANAQQVDALTGYEYFLQEKGKVDFHQVNDYLIRSGGNPIAPRTYRHFHKLLKHGIRTYMPINKFDLIASKIEAQPTQILWDEPSVLGQPNLVQELIPFIKTFIDASRLKNNWEYQYDYEILKRRQGLENSKIYTLEEVGTYLGISRERVRQIESRAIKNVQAALTGIRDIGQLPVDQNIVDEAKALFTFLRAHDVIITEDEVLKIMQDRYNNGIMENDLSSVGFLMTLCGFKALSTGKKNASRLALKPAWIQPDRLDMVLLLKVLHLVHRFLLEEIKTVSRFDIFVHVNGKLKRKVDPIYLDLASKICSDIQKIDDETYEFRFISLPSVGDKAYRVLQKANKPLHIRDILREINHLQAKGGGQANVPSRTLQQQLGLNRKKFEPIGRSGDWSLVEWEHISKETILELMQEYLHLQQTPSTAGEIFDYVHAKRESVKMNSISTYLNDHKNLFTRVASGKYGLAAWGLKRVPSDRIRIGGAEIDSQIDLAIKTFFESQKSDKLPLSFVIQGVREKTGRAQMTIRNRISELPYLDFEPHPTHPLRKYLKYLPEGQEREVLPNAKHRSAKILIREMVQNEIKNFLVQQPENSAPVSIVASNVMKKTHCLKPTFYHYLSEMDNIRKSYKDEVLFCTLVLDASPNTLLSFPQVDATADAELRDNLRRAVNNLSIDNVDLGLFQLGKIFESELRSFLTLAKTKNAFPVSNKDLDRLANMIDCLEKNGAITQKHHLTLLREQRNERAHGDIPNLVERQKLMQYAPFLGDLYLNYIILLNDKRQKL